MYPPSQLTIFEPHNEPRIIHFHLNIFRDETRHFVFNEDGSVAEEYDLPPEFIDDEIPGREAEIAYTRNAEVRKLLETFQPLTPKKQKKINRKKKCKEMQKLKKLKNRARKQTKKQTAVASGPAGLQVDRLTDPFHDDAVEMPDLLPTTSGPANSLQSTENTRNVSKSWAKNSTFKTFEAGTDHNMDYIPFSSGNPIEEGSNFNRIANADGPSDGASNLRDLMGAPATIPGRHITLKCKPKSTDERSCFFSGSGPNFNTIENNAGPSDSAPGNGFGSHKISNLRDLTGAPVTEPGRHVNWKSRPGLMDEEGPPSSSSGSGNFGENRKKGRTFLSNMEMKWRKKFFSSVPKNSNLWKRNPSLPSGNGSFAQPKSKNLANNSKTNFWRQEREPNVAARGCIPFTPSGNEDFIPVNANFAKQPEGQKWGPGKLSRAPQNRRYFNFKFPRQNAPPRRASNKTNKRWYPK